MKKLFAILTAVFLTASVFLPRQAGAQPPEKMSYQAVIRNNSDVLVTDTQVGMQISILQATEDGSPVYVETQTPTTNANGLVSIEIGDGTVLNGDFTAIDWANGPYFIKTETDLVGGTSYTITGKSQLLSVPYALHAKSAETVTESDPLFTSWNKSAGIAITESQISDLQEYLTEETQTLSISGSQLTIENGNTITLPAGGSSSIPVYTTTEIASLSPAQGDAVFNSTENLYQVYVNSTWQSFNANCWPQPTTANAGADQIFYDGTLSAILAANTPEANHGTGQWSILSGEGGSFYDATNPTTTFTGQALTTYELQWTLTTTCGSSMDKVMVEFDQRPTSVEADFDLYTDLPGDDGPVAVETDMVFVGEQIEFYNRTIDGVSYLWEFGDGYTSESESPIYSYDSPGTYTVRLNAFGYGTMEDSYTKTLHVVEGVNSALRITVLEYWDGYPVEGASVLLFGSVSDWEAESNPSEEKFTTPLGKCVFEGLNYQRYYVDVWEQNHDNYTLAAESVDFIETQSLEPGFIHDFIAYVDYYEPTKKVTLTRIGKKKLARENVSLVKSSEYRKLKENKFSQERK